MKTTMQVIKDRTTDPATIVRPAELADARFSDRSLANPPSARAWKFMAFLLSHVGEAVPEDRYHELPLARLNDERGLGNLSFAEAESLAEELRSVTMFVGITGELTADGLIGATKRPLDPDSGRKVFRWKFGESVREAYGASEIWALLERQAIMSMTSRYAMRLYEIAALRGGLRHKTGEEFTIGEIRARLGVPEGKLRTWDQLRRRAIEPAVAEVSQLTRFNLIATPVKVGRAVTKVHIGWDTKPDVVKVKRELTAHSAGRKVRRAGTAEVVVGGPVAFPAVNGVGYTPPFSKISEAAGIVTAQQSRDVSDAFRANMKAKELPLNAPNIAELFADFCRDWTA